jgi:hypothetical protein
MMTPRNAIGTTVVIVIVVIVIMIGTIGFVLFTSQSVPPATTNTASASSGQSSMSYSTVAPSGLQLQINLNMLNGTAVTQGTDLTVQVSLVNTLADNLTVTNNYPPNPTIASWNAYDFVCGSNPTWSLVGFALFVGDYSSANVSSAGRPLTLVPPLLSLCTSVAGLDRFIFLPRSSNAFAYSSVPNQPASLVNVSMSATTESCPGPFDDGGECPAGQSLFGYWNTTGLQGTLSPQNATIGSEYFRHFTPGQQYTLVAEDAWNQTAYAHFQVVSALGFQVEVVSVIGPIPPYNPGGPVVSITLKNVGVNPMIFLNATLTLRNASALPSQYSFVFNVSTSNPLLPGQSVQVARTLIGAEIGTGVSYSLAIYGTFSNRDKFSYIPAVLISPPS